MKEFINNGAVIYEGAIIEKNCIIDNGAIIYPGAIIREKSYIGPFCIIGEHTMDFYRNPGNHKYLPTEIGANSIVRANTIIYEDVKTGNDFQTGHNVTIREKSVIGKNCSIGSYSDIQGKLKMGDFVRLHSNVHLGQLTEIDDYVWLFPYVITTNDMYPPHDKLSGVKIGKYALVTTNVTILPGVTIGENSFVAAKALVTKDVKPFTFVKGSPAVEKGNIADLKDKEGNSLYPWKEYLEEYRAYPWQEEMVKQLKK